MTLATRFALPLLVVVAVAFGAVLAQRLHPRYVDPCRDPESLRRVERIPGTSLEQEKSGRIAIQTSGGTLDGDTNASLQFTLIRTFGSRLMFMRPLSLAKLPGVVEAQDQRVEELRTEAGSIPVHVLRTASGDQVVLVEYFYVYGLDPVEQPFVAKAVGAPKEALLGQQPLTLVWASAKVSRAQLGPARERMERWLADAWEHFEAACRAPARVAEARPRS